MEFNPSAPPPSYDDVVGNSNQNQKSQIGFVQTQQQQFNYNAGTFNVPYQQQPVIQQSPIHPNLGPPNQPQYNEVQTNIVLVQGGPVDLGHFPVRLICPSCHQSTLTRVERNSSWVTHSMALLLCVTGLFIFSCLPYCMTPCKNTVHYCRKCGKYLGTHQFGT